MSFKIIISPISKLIAPLQIPLVLACLAIPSCNAQEFRSNGTHNQNEDPQNVHTKTLTVIFVVAIGLSVIIMMLGLAICIDRRCLRDFSGPTQQNHSTIFPSNPNCRDVILSFSRQRGQMMPMTMRASAPFYQNNLCPPPPPPYHLAIHYAPLQLPTYRNIEENSEASAEFQNPDSNFSVTMSISAPPSASVAKTTATNSGMINPSFDKNV